MYYGPGNGIGPVSDMARELLNMKQDKVLWDRHTQSTSAAMGGGGGASAAAKPGGGGGGGGTAAPLKEDPKERAYKDDLADQMFGRGKYSSGGAESAMMSDATSKNRAFWDKAGSDYASAAIEKEYQKSQGRGGGQPPQSIGDQIQSNSSPMGANGQELATDQNGGTQSSSPAPDQSSSDEQASNEEDGFTQVADSSDNVSGYARKGGRVQAGKKYIVGEGGDPEVYMQDDGDMYGLNQRMGIVPEEDGTIIPHDKLRMMARKHLARGK